MKEGKNESNKAEKTQNKITIFHLFIHERIAIKSRNILQNTYCEIKT